jgi:hypothetical protein
MVELSAPRGIRVIPWVPMILYLLNIVNPYVAKLVRKYGFVYFGGVQEETVLLAGQRRANLVETWETNLVSGFCHGIYEY